MVSRLPAQMPAALFLQVNTILLSGVFPAVPWIRHLAQSQYPGTRFADSWLWVCEIEYIAADSSSLIVWMRKLAGRCDWSAAMKDEERFFR